MPQKLNISKRQCVCVSHQLLDQGKDKFISAPPDFLVSFNNIVLLFLLFPLQPRHSSSSGSFGSNQDDLLHKAPTLHVRENIFSFKELNSKKLLVLLKSKLDI